MRFQFDTGETTFDANSVGNSIIFVRDKDGLESKHSLSIAKPIDSILPGPVLVGEDEEGNQFHFLAKDNKIFLHYRGRTYNLKLAERVLEMASSLSKEIKSPMPGKVLKIFKNVGDSFQKGEALGILEAMKMENQLKAGFSGTVTKILKKEGDVVNQDELLMELEPFVEL
ncbi:MAG: acetyl-CoA carboxylase biotin carboxyl carrier protein subunit [Leptospira sp.]|nr:acetyl-CoA carboxylase biotin carboxyl carrier protein subunit [Leptospira sp.]